MPRYIDAEKIKFDLTGLIYIAPTDIRKIGAYFIRQLKDMPIADVVEVVRCKDCRFSHLTYSGDCKDCDKWTDDDGYNYTLYLDGNFYCGYGERREDA